MDHLEYCVQVLVGKNWQQVTAMGHAIVFSNPDSAFEFCDFSNKQRGKYHRAAVRTVGDWCEMKREGVR